MFDPRQFLDLADALLDDSKYEKQGRIRTCIGRAYYAAFLLSMKKLQEIGHSFREVDRLHKDVISTLMNEKKHFISSQLDKLREYRVNADYKMKSKITSELGKRCIMLSRKIMHSIEQI